MSKFSYEFSFTYLKEGESEKLSEQECKLEATGSVAKLPLPKPGDKVSFAWEGQERTSEVSKWQFHYTVKAGKAKGKKSGGAKGTISGLHLVISLDPIREWKPRELMEEEEAEYRPLFEEKGQGK